MGVATMFKIVVVSAYIVFKLNKREYADAVYWLILVVLLFYGIDLLSFRRLSLFSIGFSVPRHYSVSFTIFKKLGSLVVILAKIVYRFWFDVYELLPTIIGRWRRSRELWYSVEALSEPDEYAALCDRCRRWTSNSNLIMGSKNYLSRTVEFHRPCDSLAAMGQSIQDAGKSCHLCSQMWYSIEHGLRQDVEKRESYCSDVKVQIKVWEERPFSNWTFAQLIGGNKVIGARLLIHREENHQMPMLSKSSQSPSTDSWLHIEQAKEWLNSCSLFHNCRYFHLNEGDAPANHTDFPLVQSHIVASNSQPKRLLYIGPRASPDDAVEVPKIRIQEYDELEQRPEYLVLSHCWGGSNHSWKLLAESESSAIKSIPFLDLSKNIRDTIQITQRLGYTYVWIDSLCIIQDSSEDWLKESIKMGSIYARAVCTIASTGSDSGDGGCFHERNCLSLQPCKIGVRSHGPNCTVAIYVRRDDVSDFQRSVDNAPLNQRGWVFQERLLSTRILHFGGELLYWECRQRSASELNSNGYIYKAFPKDFGDHHSLDDETRFDRRSNAEGSPSDQNTREIPQIAYNTESLSPEQPTLDPNDRQRVKMTWQRKRDLWKDIRIASPRSWEEDRGNIDGTGFRAEFDILRLKTYSGQQIGMSSFSHCWYGIVEAYTRGKLTFPTDKLVAISGIVKEIQVATGYTYLAGLWKEHLLTNLLWFTVEGPGHRLSNVCEAPLTEDPPEYLLVDMSEDLSEDWSEYSSKYSSRDSYEHSSENPSQDPSEALSEHPSEDPSEALSEHPSEDPSETLSEHPIEGPSESLSEHPFEDPSENLSEHPSEDPSENLSEHPSEDPSEALSEHPSKSLLSKYSFIVSTSVAPTWSWASLEGVVGVDLLPENLQSEIYLQATHVTFLNVTIGAIRYKNKGEGMTLTSLQGVLEMKGPLLEVVSAFEDIIAYLQVSDEGYHLVRFVPDVIRTDEYRKLKLFCLPCITIERWSNSYRMGEEIQGLVLTAKEQDPDEHHSDAFERVGFFTTTQTQNIDATNKLLAEAPVRTLFIV